MTSRAVVLLCVFGCSLPLHAQVAPTLAETAGYSGLLAAAARGDAAQINGEDPRSGGRALRVT